MATRAPRESLLSRLSRERFGGPTRLLWRVVPVGATPTRVLVANPERVMWSVWNVSAVAGALWFEEGFTVDMGIPLPASGASVQFVADEDGEACGYPVWCVLASGTGNVVVVEVVRL